MANQFDPYHKWLGILPKDQPPNHYRLLGLELYEDDPDVISAAADRQQSFLRSHQSGERGADASRLMNEVARARLCLLKAETKRAYDADLRKQKEAALSANANENPPEIVASKLPPHSSTRTRPAWKHPLVIGGACLAVVLLVGLMLAPGSKSRHGATVIESPVDDRPVATNVTPPDEAAKPPGDEPAPPTKREPIQRSVNLLAKIDPSADVIDGEFTREADGTLYAKGRGRCRVPFDFPEDYRVAMRVERQDSVDTLGLVLPCAGRHLLFAIDGWYGAETGFYIDGRDANNNCVTHRGRVLTSGKPADVVLTIHPRHVTIECDGKTVVDWHGDPQRLSLPGGYRVPNAVAMLNPLVPFRIQKMELTPLEPETETRAPRPTTTVNLLEHVELKHDVIAGEWSSTRQGLRALKGISHARVQIGQPLPREYTLRLKVTRPAERPGGFVVAFPTGETATQIVFDVNGCCGLDTIDDIRWDWSETRVVGDRLPGGVEHDVEITVRNDRIALTIDKAPLIDWQGDFSRLNIPGDWANPDSRRVTVGGDSEWSILEATVAPPEQLPEIPGRVSQPVDLLQLVDARRDAYWGEWVFDAARLQSPTNGVFARLALPALVPDEYVLTLDVERQPGGAEDALLIGLPVGPRFAQVLLDGWSRTKSGMYLDGRDASENSVTNATRAFETGKKSTVTCTVHRNGVKVECDGRRLIDWRGDPRRLSADQATTIPLRGRPFLGSWNTSYVFSRIQLSPTPTPGTPFPPPRTPVNGNLLGIVKVDRDAVRGNWRLNQGILRSPICPAARLELPVDPPPQYVLSAVVTRHRGDDSLYFELLVGGQNCTLMFDGFGSRFTGLELIDGLRAPITRRGTRQRSSRLIRPHASTVSSLRIRSRC